jgi:hypothetical protein
MTTETTAPAELPAEVPALQRDESGIIDWDAAPAETPAASDATKAATADGTTSGDPESGEHDAVADADAEKSDADKAEDRKRLSGAQRAKQQRQALLDEIAARDRRIAELEAAGKTDAGKSAGEDAAPKEADYSDWFAYQRALTAYEARQAATQATREALKSSEESARREREARAVRERREAHLERVEAAKDIIVDFDTVMEGMKDVNVRNDVIDEIMASDNSALLAYHLAQHPDQLQALDAMQPRELARAIGRLEATLKMPEPKKRTTAPAPLSKLKGGATPRDEQAELNAWLDKKYGKARKR